MKKHFSSLFALLLTLSIGFGQASLSNPYTSIYNHLHNLESDNYNPEQSALSFPAGSLTENERIELAIQLKEILDGKGLYIQMNLVPENPDYRDSLSREYIYTLSELEPRIYLEKIGEQWLYSKETIKKLDDIYHEVYPFGTKMFSKLLPVKTRNIVFFGLFLWQWLGILIIIVSALILFFLIERLTNFLFHFILYKRRTVSDENKTSLLKITKAFSLVLVFSFIYKIVPALLFSVQTLQYLVKTIAILLIFLVAILVIRIASHALSYFTAFVENTSSKLDDQLLPIIRKMVNMVIMVIAISLALKQLNVNLTAILAGLSIGGLALALASQDTVKNFIGSVTIFIDHPFEIGDYIILSGTEGTVEEVGMRATRIRTPNQSVAYIPNGDLSNRVIDNYGLRVYRRWKWFIGVEYDTSPKKIEEFCKRAKEVINDYESVANDNTVVRLHELGDFSIKIFVNIFLDVNSYNLELDCKHDLLIRLMVLAEEMEVSFAFPTQTLHLKQ